MTLEQRYYDIVGTESILTAKNAAKAFAFMTDYITAEITKVKPETPLEVKQEFTTPSRLSRIFDVEKTAMLRTLKAMREQDGLKVYRLPCADGAGHPRYRISEVQALAGKHGLERQIN